MREKYKIDCPLISCPILKYNRIELVNNDDVIEILPTDPFFCRKAIYKIALYFKREFKYDFVQYSVEEDYRKSHHAFAFVKWNYDGKYLVYGAFCMRWRNKMKEIMDHWGLQWIWLHPFERCKGHLSEIWEGLNHHFPGFIVESPLSSGMLNFLEKRKCIDSHASYDSVRK